MCRSVRVRAPLVAAGLLFAAAALAGNVTVDRRQLTFEEEHVLVVNSSVEYILQFVPAGDQGAWPSRLAARAAGGDAAHPLLVTARRATGAQTWQLPYSSGASMLYGMERSLCPDDSVITEVLSEDCEDDAGPAARARGSFSLHVGTSCAANVAVSLRADPQRDWHLAFDTPLAVLVAQGAPRVHYYGFAAEQHSVRLVVQSQDDVCATVAVQNYTCPIAETLDDVEISALRMTVARSGGAQLARAQYPRGFYVIVLVHDSDDVCREQEPSDDDWLWEAAVLSAQEPGRVPPAAPRAKTITLHIKESLSRAQYALGVSVTLVLFMGFYVAFGLLVLAQRHPRCAQLVGPRAVLAGGGARAGGEPRADGLSPSRQRRHSTATFDSSDNSDSDQSDSDAAQKRADSTCAGVDDTRGLEDTRGVDDSRGDADSRHAGIDDTRSVDNTRGGVDSRHAGVDDTHAGAGGVANTYNGTYIFDVERSIEQAAPSASVAPGVAGTRPFGLPAQLNVAALARRRERVLHARSDRYLYTLWTVALFYTLPVVQFVAAFQVVLNVSGSLDMCYYNFLCAHPAGALSDFNHVFSNAGYLLLGALFLLQEYGIPAHYGLLSSLGAAMMMVALLSAAYHVCPNRLNFQFDTAFMYVMAVLSMVKIYQARHPDVNARAHATFAALAVLIALVVWGVLAGGPLFWSVFTVLHVFTVLLLSLNIYYVGQFRLEKESLQEAARGLRTRPLYVPRLVMVLVTNAVNWAFALYGLFTQSADFASHLLNVLLCNTLVYMMFYIGMKLLHGERLRWYAWVYLGAAAAAWAPAMYFFLSGSTSWSTTPALSRHRNHECLVLQFYDSHDLWHMLSAAALYFSFNAMLTWDDGLAAVPRARIAVF